MRRRRRRGSTRPGARRASARRPPGHGGPRLPGSRKTATAGVALRRGTPSRPRAPSRTRLRRGRKGHRLVLLRLLEATRERPSAAAVSTHTGRPRRTCACYPDDQAREVGFRGTLHVCTDSIQERANSRLAGPRSPDMYVLNLYKTVHNLYRRSSMRTLVTSLGSVLVIAVALVAPAAGSPGIDEQGHRPGRGVLAAVHHARLSPQEGRPGRRAREGHLHHLRPDERGLRKAAQVDAGGAREDPALLGREGAHLPRDRG